MDYYSHYKFILNYYDKDISLLITQYIYAKCIDCNDSWYDEFYECKCNDLRCKQHAYIKTIIVKNNICCNKCIDIEEFDKSKFDNIEYQKVSILCIRCPSQAKYGYKDILCYCGTHNIFRKSILYVSLCFHFNCVNIAIYNDNKCIDHSSNKDITYIDRRISILCKNESTTTETLNTYTMYNKRQKCAFCNKIFINMFNKCNCSIYCDYCYSICVWRERDNYVCNYCSIDNKYADELYTFIICHEGDCLNYADHGKYGILLYCSKHAKYGKYDKLNYGCKKINCEKLVVYKNRCYDHVNNKIRNKIDYIIKN